jgi:hypothetical protein
MLKKSAFIATIVGVACIGISNIGYAASFTGWDKMVAPHKRPIKYRYQYVRLGGGIYDFKSSKIEVGTVGSTTAPLDRIHDTKITPFYNLAVGCAFYNSKTSWITRVFGHDNAVELQLDYFNVKKEKNRPGSLGTGQIWWIDGRGSFMAVPRNVQNAYLNAKHRYINGGLYYKGRWITRNPRITFMPRAGAILTSLRQKYYYTVQYYTGAVYRTDKEDYKVNTYYYGVAAGGRLAYEVKSRFSVFGDLEAQALGVHAKLNADQDIFVESSSPATRTTVTNKKSAFTYRAILAVGGEYKINNKINSPSVEVKGGIDRWGYSPRVVPPNNTGSGPVHIVGTQENNYFANIGVTIPIG